MTERATGRILRSLSGFYDVQTEKGLVTCRARGILRRSILKADLARLDLCGKLLCKLLVHHELTLTVADCDSVEITYSKA